MYVFDVVFLSAACHLPLTQSNLFAHVERWQSGGDDETRNIRTYTATSDVYQPSACKFKFLNHIDVVAQKSSN